MIIHRFPDHTRRVISNAFIEGNHLVITGNKNTVRGNHNTIRGDDNTCHGSELTIEGKKNRHFGHGGRYKGTCRVNGIPYQRLLREQEELSEDIPSRVLRFIEEAVSELNPPPPKKQKTSSTLYGIEVPDESKKSLDEPCTSDEDKCALCLTNKKRCAAMPCGQMVMCVECSIEYIKMMKRDAKCPTCREKITEMKLIYL